MRYTIFLLLVLAASALAEEPPLDPALANCSWYRSKRNDVPVYGEAATTSEVIGRAERGERVCGIGEQGEFAILEWGNQAILRGGKKERDCRGFVRLVDVWQPRDRSDQPGKKPKEISGYRKTGTSPDDPIWFMRPFLDLFFSRDPCADPTRIGCAEEKKQ